MGSKDRTAPNLCNKARRGTASRASCKNAAVIEKRMTRR
jgi:hypothetical protein